MGLVLKRCHRIFDISIINLFPAAVASNNDPIYSFVLDRICCDSVSDIPVHREQRPSTWKCGKPSMLRKCYSVLRVLDSVVQPESSAGLLPTFAKLGYDPALQGAMKHVA